MQDTSKNSDNQLNSYLIIPPEEKPQFIPHYMRIPTFILFLILNLQCGLSLSAYTPLDAIFSKYYNFKISTVVLSSTLFLVGNAISVFIVYPLNKNLGITNCVRIGLIFNFLGSGMRVLINHNFYWVLIGQFLMGFASCCVYNNQMEFNFNWFPEKSRAIFNSILTLSVYIGGGLGNSIPLIFINEKNITSQTQAQSQVFDYSVYMFIFIGCLSLINLLIFRGSPPSGFG